MKQINRTRISMVVNAAFVTMLEGQLVAEFMKSLEAKPYEYGLFAEQDIRVLMSMIYTRRSQLVGLMDGSDKPLQDQPKQGSLEANDTGAEDANEIERREAIKQLSYELAVLERHLISLDEQARRDLEEAGHTTSDGGRKHYNRKNRQYKSYVNTWEEWLVDQKARTPVASNWARKLERAEEEVVLPIVSAQEATDRFMGFLDDERVDRSSARAWEQVEDSLFEIGTEQARHAKVMDALNNELAMISEAYKGHERKLKVDALKARMALASAEHREAINFPMWLLQQRLAPTALLAHAGAPKALIESPEWKTREAEELAAKAQADTAMAQAQFAQMKANMLLMESNMALMQQQQLLQKMAKEMAAKQREFNALMNPPKEPKAKVVKKAKTKVVKNGKAKDELFPKARTGTGVNVLSSRGSCLTPSFRRVI